ncbi:MAG: CoA transferase [Pseudomonadales bacterium]|nr:CoA transferase [Pseudomonadales bacterium]MCP5185705.1 CoA transferase [Pseudomonadales bacterium]
MSGPLEGLRVVDFSRVLAGPFCGRTLQDLGATVIKIEPPRGDVSRLAAPINANGITGYYAQQNAGKRNISIDLNKPGAREIAHRLCDQADILVENFRPGTLSPFGFDYASLRARNPRLIYVSISGYGQGGPWRGRMAYAPTVQAEAGFTHHLLRHFGDNLKAPQTDALSHADVYAGMQATIAVLAALQQRARTGEGQHIDVAMAATLMAINEHAHMDLNGLDPGDDPAILGATDGSFFTGPNGERFLTAISLVNAITFNWFAAAMRRPDLLDEPRFRTSALRRANLAQLQDVVQKWIWSFPDMATVDAQFDEAKIAIGEVRSMEHLADSEWAGYWEATCRVPDRQGGEYRLPGRPWKFSGSDLPPMGAPSLQGEQNVEICRELGFTDAEIEGMQQDGSLVGNFTAQMIAMVMAENARKQARWAAANEQDGEGA